MTLLPFKTNAPTGQVKLIEDGFGNSIEIPSYGCLTFNEEQAINSYYLTLKESVTRTEVKLQEVTILLRSRFKLPSLTPEEVIEAAVTMPMIDRLADFVNGERTRWVPSGIALEAAGDEAEESAWLCAQRIEGIVASRADLTLQKRWIVVRSHADLPEGFDVLEDFTKGKRNSNSSNQSPPIGLPSTGN